MKFVKFDYELLFAVRCVYGTKFVYKTTYEIYGNGLSCDICGKGANNNQYAHHCPKDRSPYHTGGYAVCPDCDDTQFEDPNKDDSKTDK